MNVFQLFITIVLLNPDLAVGSFSEYQLYCARLQRRHMLTVEGFLRNGERQPGKNVHDSEIDHASFKLY